MLTAVDLKTQIQNNYFVETEIYLLYVGILTSRDMGNSTFILNKDIELPVNEILVTGSPMTTNAAYYSVWQGITVDNRLTLEMQKVIDRYTQLGYTISRKTTDMEHLYWQITW